MGILDTLKAAFTGDKDNGITTEEELSWADKATYGEIVDNAQGTCNARALENHYKQEPNVDEFGYHTLDTTALSEAPKHCATEEGQQEEIDKRTMEELGELIAPTTPHSEEDHAPSRG